jgi:hypothetical protein
MSKKIKFIQKECKSIIEGKITTTFRIFDEKNITEADELIFITAETKEEFARVIVTSTKITTFGQLTDNDWEGLEKIDSDEELFNKFEKYYHRKVDWNTPVKIIKFNLETKKNNIDKEIINK